MSPISERIKTRFTNLHTLIPPSKNDWTPAIVIALVVLLPALVKWALFDFLPWLWQFWPKSSSEPQPLGLITGFQSLTLLAGNDPLLSFFFVVAAFVLCVTTFILIVSFFIYILARPPICDRAGKTFSKAFAFITLNFGIMILKALIHWPHSGS
jgi:hypothetical protein